jgi:hypothetical protein
MVDWPGLATAFLIAAKIFAVMLLALCSLAIVTRLRK